MNGAQCMELEVLEANLREWGCPYSAGDERTEIWLEAYSAGWRVGYMKAAETAGVDVSAWVTE